MKKRIAITGMVIIIVLLAGFYFFEKKHFSKNTPANQNDSNQTFKIVLPIADTISHLIVNYGIDHGFYLKQGLNVQIVDVQGAPFNVLASNQADAELGGISRPMSVYFNDMNPRLVANGFVAFGSAVVSRFDKEHANQIKSVAINSAGGEEQAMVETVLKNLGVDPKNVQEVTAPTASSRVAMLERGDADLIICYQNDYNVISNQQKYFLLDNSLLLQNSTFLRSIVSTQDILNKEPEKMQKFINGFYDSLNGVQNDKSEVTTYVQNKLSISNEQAIDFYNQFIAARQGVSFVPALDKQLQSIAEANKNATTDPQRDLSQFIYPDFAKKATAAK